MPEKVTSLNGLKVTLEYGSHNIGAHNVYYVKYGGFALKFMSPSLSGTYR